MPVQRLEIAVTGELHFGPVVKTRSPHRAIVHSETGDTDNVQRHVYGGAETSDVTGVGRNLRFYEGDREHESYISQKHKKKRRASLEGLVVSFVRPRRPQMFVC